MTTGVTEVRDFTKCHKCGNDTFFWSFTGWDKITIDADGGYNRGGKGEYEDTNVECSKCEATYIGEE